MLAAAMLLVVGVSGARAETVQLDNRAQPGMGSAVPQRPLELSVRGSCPFARTLEEARGKPSTCAPGTWPAPGGNWSPTVDVASGDTLALAFETPQQSVAVAATSNYSIGLVTPDGVAVPNELLPGFGVAATPNPSVWLVTIPVLDLRFWSESFSSIAVTARDASDGSARNVVFRVQTPRWLDEELRCGPAFYSPQHIGYRCDGGPPPGGVPPTPERPGPRRAPRPPASAELVAVLAVRFNRGCSRMIVELAGARGRTVLIKANVAGRQIVQTRRAMNKDRVKVRLKLDDRARDRLHHGETVRLTVMEGGRTGRRASPRTIIRTRCPT